MRPDVTNDDGAAEGAAAELSRLDGRLRMLACALSRCRAAFQEAGPADTFAIRAEVARAALKLKGLAAALADWAGI
jgi:hypothetical protein